MIKSKDFLQKFSTLTEEQRTVLTRQVLEYQEKMLPALNEAEEPWSDDVCEMFDEGLKLISTLPSAQSFCLVAYKYKEARKRIDGFCHLFIQLLNSLVTSGDIEEEPSTQSAITGKNINPGAFRATPPSHLVIGAKFVAGEKTGKAGRPEKPKNMPKVPAAGVKLENTILVNADGSDPLDPTIAERPKHLDQYIHLLPETLQVEASKIGDLYAQMADCSAKLQQLCDDPTSTQKDRAYHAMSLCQIEDKIRNLWDRIDIAYAEATGKSVSPEYKGFLDAESVRINGVLKEKSFAEMTKFDIDNIEDSSVKEQAKEARINRDKKFLRKDDRKGDEQHRQNLIDAATELHDWGILLTDTQAAVCQKYGFDVPTDWVTLPLEERRKLQQQARNEKRKEERAKAKAERLAQKEAEEAESPYNSEGLGLFK